MGVGDEDKNQLCMEIVDGFLVIPNFLGMEGQNDGLANASYDDCSGNCRTLS
ncbi:hypothetical protein D3C76_1823360 [compost metagenome]